MTTTETPVEVPVTFTARARADIAEPDSQLMPEQAGTVRLFIAVPTYGFQVSVITAAALTTLCRVLKENGIDYRLKFHDGERAPRARNKICAEFLDSDYSHLLFVDWDIGFETKDVLAMLAVNVHIVGGVYPIKHYDSKRAATSGSLEAGLDYVVQQTYPANQLRGCIEANEIGCGFMLIKRELLEQFAAFYPHMSYADDFWDNQGAHITAFFFEGIVNDRWLSEDYWFCAYWRRMGGKVWAWPWAKLAHAGQHVFAGEFDKRLAVIGSGQTLTTQGE